MPPLPFGRQRRRSFRGKGYATNRLNLIESVFVVAFCSFCNSHLSRTITLYSSNPQRIQSCSDIQNCGKCLNKSKFDCVWHVSDTFEGSCVESHQCDSLDGECFEGQDGKKKYNKLVCGDTCGVHSGITECLDFDAMGKKKRQTKNSDCAWFVNDGEDKCIGSKRCREKEKENPNGWCVILSVIDDPIINLPPPFVSDCTDFDGLCTDCLNMGCSWINSGKECVDSCTLAPADLGCSTLPNQDNRKLLSFQDEASRMCYDFNLEDKNIDLCQKVEGGCERCVTTQLFNPPDMAYIWPPTCKWFPETDTCYPFDSGSNTTFLGEGTDKCKEPTIVIDDPIVIVDPKPEDPIVKPKPKKKKKKSKKHF